VSSIRKHFCPTDEAIESAAAAWLSERDQGFDSAQAAEFERWRTADPRHAAAIAMLEETRDLLGQMPALRGDPELHRRMEKFKDGTRVVAKVYTFPRVVAALAAVAACVAVTLSIVRLNPERTDATPQTSYLTAVDEYRRIVLPDQSVMELNGGTRARVEFSRTRRHVVLDAGEAHFTVEKNPARPFVVNAGAVGIRAVGTAFSVRLDSTAVAVVVTEGKVQVGRFPTPSTSATNDPSDTMDPIFSAGQQVVVETIPLADFSPRVSVLDHAAQRKALAWREPRLVFHETRLAQVVQEFNRHNRVQLEIGDLELREHAVGGTFQADGVESFVRLLEESGDVAVERVTAERIILRKVSAPREP
jgi:transmembrane sensor